MDARTLAILLGAAKRGRLDAMYPHGVDLSHHQAEPISFNRVRRAGNEFIGLKVSQGATMVDPMFAVRRSRSNLVGFKRLLLYHFLVPGIPARVQAEHFAKTLGGLAPNETPVLDVEGDAWRTLDDPAALIEETVFHAKQLLNVKAARIMLYTPVVAMRDVFGSEFHRLTFMPLWLARYVTKPPDLTKPEPGDVGPWPNWTCWQYSQTGRVDGFDGPVDLNVWNAAVPL